MDASAPKRGGDPAAPAGPTDPSSVSAPSVDRADSEPLDDILHALAQAPPRRELARPGHRWGDNGRYVIQGVLGRGGMGLVYRALDVEMDREVALKTLPDLVPSEITALKEEFRALAGVSHENLIELYDLVVTSADAPDELGPRVYPHAFFTMELLDGKDVFEHVRGHARRAGAEVEAPAEGWLERLVRALAQLARAVSALHRAGKLHRDIKPSNVWVTTDGRLVLLDFGLAVAVAEGTGGRLPAAGTLFYMAPEQIERGRLSPATDWYGVGEVLYELLTGELAFGGSKSDVVAAKSQTRLRAPVERAAGVPPALDALTVALLRPDPAARASEADVVRTLDALGVSIAEDDARPPASTPFVGREVELSALRAALAQATGGAPVLVRIEGASGIGKTGLVRRFAGELGDAGNVLVLRGRCHPQESVPYKAFDAIVDELGAFLARLPRTEAARLVPHNVGALARVFPALEILVELRGPRAEEQAIEPAELRRRGFEALGALLSAIARERRTVLWVDDLQWGDADSVLLLRELLVAAGATLFVVAYRSEGLERNPVLADFDRSASALPLGASVHLRLSPLSDAPSRALATHILGDARRDDHGVATIVAEAAGSPFFIAELARHAARPPSDRPPGAGAPGRLASVIHDRFARLRPPERHLLEIVATAGGPIDRSVALAAAGLGERGRPDVARLAQACLLRTVTLGGRPAIEAYHDRIGETLVVALSASRRRELHRQLADALRATADADPDALFRHYLGAEDRPRAAQFVVAAADRARAKLAFARAAERYADAIALGVPDRAHLRERLGECLVNAGRGAEAPPHFLAAAEERADDPTAALVLRRQAAEQLVRNGRFDEGTAIFRRVLGDVGIAMPRSNLAASLRAGSGLLRLFARGLDYELRAAEDIPPRTLHRLDAMFGAWAGFSMMNPTLASVFGIRHLLEALDAGEPSRIAYAVLYEAVFEAAIGGRFLRKRAARMLALGADLADRVGDPTLRGFKQLAYGHVAWHEGRFPEALARCEEALHVFDNECRGAAWHHVATENYALSSLAFIGDMRALSTRRRAAHKWAAERGDEFGAAICRTGQLNIATLAEDDPAQAIADADSVIASWPLRLYHHTIIATQADLYRGDGDGALRRINAAWPRLRGDGLLRLELPRIELLHLRARAALAAAASGDRRAGALLKSAARWATDIAASELPPARPFSASIHAGIARIARDRTREEAARRQAALGFDAAGMKLYAAAHRLALGEAGAWGAITALGVAKADAMARMLGA